jgi:hypothetical protein
MNLLDFYLSVKEEQELETVMAALKKAVAEELLNGVKPMEGKEEKTDSKKDYARRFNAAKKSIKIIEEKDGRSLTAEEQKYVKKYFQENDLTVPQYIEVA